MQRTVVAFAPESNDEVQPVDACSGKLIKVYMGQSLDKWHLDGDNVEKWESDDVRSSELDHAMDRRGHEEDRQ